MGRVYDTIISGDKRLHSLFDTGAVHNYITLEAAEGFVRARLSKPLRVGLGGKSRTVEESCIVIGELHGNQIDFLARIVTDIGKDERDREIDVIIGATEMQRWNIRIDPKGEKLDLSGFRREFIEY